MLLSNIVFSFYISTINLSLAYSTTITTSNNNNYYHYHYHYYFFYYYYSNQLFYRQSVAFLLEAI